MAQDESEEYMPVGEGIKHGFICLGVAVGIFLLITFLESNGGGRVPWWIALLYYIGGKWTASGVFVACSLFFFGAAFRSYRNGDG